MSKVDLIYIASIGRSGSTLLESMLGAHSRMTTTGELHIWPHELRQNGVQPCGCGQEVPKCPFWSEVRRNADPLSQVGPGVDFFREAHNHGRTLRLRRLPAFSPTPTSNLRDRDKIETYGKNNAAVFDAFLAASISEGKEPVDWVVDASKDPYRLAWLARSGFFNVKVIHLVKNPRGFVYSVTKRHIHGERGSPPSTAAVRLYYTARQMVAWTTQNTLFARLAKNVLPPESYMLLQYEQLASSPHQTFRQVCDFIGLPYEASAVESFREGSVHTIAGNPMRYENRAIRLDERWKTKLPRSSRRVASIIARWTEAQYGYRDGSTLSSAEVDSTTVA